MKIPDNKTISTLFFINKVAVGILLCCLLLLLVKHL